MPSPKTPPPKADKSSLPRGTMVRMGAAATLAAVLLYVVAFWQPTGAAVDPANLAIEPPAVAVPEIDRQLLEKAKDGTHEERLFLESEPLSHLLAQSLNVSDDASRALGMPSKMVDVAELRAEPAHWRGRYLFYRGKVEHLSAPRPGNPVPGYSIHEATLRLADGSAVLFTFSRPPGEGVHVGGWARAEGFLLKLRDVAFPAELTSAPLLVGAQLVEDFEDWQPVVQLDRERLGRVLDTQRHGDQVEPTPDAWRGIAEDQAVPLWHLGAYARDVRDSATTDWHKAPILNSQETWSAFKADGVERGTPMRIIGILATIRTTAAHPNPAGITEWSEAWLQVRDLGGKTIPIWVPKSVQCALGASLEVRGYYYRRYAYESRSGQQYWTPLFVAADLDPLVLDLGSGMKEITLVMLGVMVAFLIFIFVSQRRESRRVLDSEDALIERRRRRRAKTAAVAAAGGTQ